MLAGYQVVEGNSAGKFTGGGWKLCIHTTEGSSATGAIGAYRKNNSWPHFTIDADKNQKIQHLELNVAARSLYNDSSDGYDVGRANVIQVEIVGFAKDSPGWSDAKLKWLADRFKEIRAQVNFALVHPEFIAGRQPFTDKGWVDFSGIVGHQHAPDNKNGHWDPGALNVTKIISFMGDPVKPPEIVDLGEDVESTTLTVTIGKDGKGWRDIDTGKFVKACWTQLNSSDPKERYPNFEGVVDSSTTRGNYAVAVIEGAKPNTKFDVRIFWVN
jgi:hypothetical protein